MKIKDVEAVKPISRTWRYIKADKNKDKTEVRVGRRLQ